MSFGGRRPVASQRSETRTRPYSDIDDEADVVEIVERVEVDEVVDRTGYDLAQAESALVGAITTSVLEGVKQLGIGERHSEVIDAITNVTVEPPDLQPILNAIARINNHRESRQEVLDALSTIVVDPPDLMPILAAIENVGTREQHAQVFEGFHRDFSILVQEMRHDLAALRQEVLENRKETRSDAEVLLEELRALPQVIAEIKHSLRKLEQKVDQGEVLQAVRKLRLEPDYAAIASAVHERRLKVDHSELFEALKRLEPDHHAAATVLVEKLRKEPLGEMLAAIKRIRVDHQEIANAVHDRLILSSGLPVDHSEVLKELKKYRREADLAPVLAAVEAMEVDLSPVMNAISKIKLEVDHGPVLNEIRKLKVPSQEEIATQVHNRIRSHTFNVDNSDVLSAIKKLNAEPDLSPIISAINSAEIDLGPIHDAIGNIKFSVDHGPVLEAIRRINVPDHQEIATSVHERLRKILPGTDNAEVLKELKKLRSEKTDLSPVLAAINSAEIDLSPLHEAINKINVTVDHGEVLQAIRKIEIPDHNVIAHAVHEKFRKNNSILDHGELIKEMRKTRVEPDISPVLAAISQAEIDFTPMIEEIKKVNVTVDNTQVLQALTAMRMEIMTAVSQPRELREVREVVQPAPPLVQAVLPVQAMMTAAAPPLQQVLPVQMQQQVVAESGPPLMQTWRAPRRDATPTPPFAPPRQASAWSAANASAICQAQPLTPASVSSSMLAPPTVATGNAEVVFDGFEVPKSPRRTSPSPARQRGPVPRNRPSWETLSS